MRLPEIYTIAERGLHLYNITKDPLTFSACTLLLKAKSPKLTEPEQNGLDLLQRQLEAYKTIFPGPLP